MTWEESISIGIFNPSPFSEILEIGSQIEGECSLLNKVPPLD